MRAAGAYRIAHPRAWGGPETTPMDQVRIVEELASWNGSAAWCVMIGSDGGYYSAGMDQEIAREMWADLDMPTGSTAFPPGRAVAVEGGFRVTGRWPYGSGNAHSGWMGGHCVVFDGDTPRPGPRGNPMTMLAFVQAGQFETFDNWNTTGLRGSGSCDWAVTDLFVPAERCSDGFGVLTPRREGPLYQFPAMFLCNQPGVCLGLARAAISELQRIAATKQTFGQGLRDQPHVQAALGLAHARYRAARGYVMTTLEDMWATLCAGERVSIQQRTDFRLSNTHAHKESLTVVEAMYELAGGSALTVPSTLDRALRDVLATNQHVVASRSAYGIAGQYLLGLEPNAFGW
jgi:alkylation response protein AidB-like acyl-CoA dehydrogenase